MMHRGGRMAIAYAEDVNLNWEVRSACRGSGLLPARRVFRGPRALGTCLAQVGGTGEELLAGGDSDDGGVSSFSRRKSDRGGVADAPSGAADGRMSGVLWWPECRAVARGASQVAGGAGGWRGNSRERAGDRGGRVGNKGQREPGSRDPRTRTRRLGPVGPQISIARPGLTANQRFSLWNSVTLRMFPSGSLNHATFAPFAH